MRTVMKVALAAAGVGMIAQPALAQDKVKVATTFLGLWDTSQPTLCQERGEFKKAGLDVEVTSTRGGSENIQAVIAGGMDIGYSPGLNAVLAAYAQGNKLKVVSAEFLGQNDTFFYVPKDSPIKSTKDLNGKTVAFPRPGGASEALLLAFKHDSKLDIKPVATGGMDATMTMTMTKQVDVGYSIPPAGLAAVDEGKIRVLFAGDDVKSQANITGRVIVVKADYLAKHRAVVGKFLETLDKCIDWAYANKAESSKFYGKLNKVDAKIAEKGIAFYDRKTLAFGPIKGMDQTMKQAVEGKFLAKPLTADELKDLVDIVYTTKK